MPIHFRSLIEASDQPGPEYVPSWQRAGSILLVIFIVVLWIAAAGALVATALIAFAGAVMGPGHAVFWSEMMPIYPLATLFVGASVLARDFVPMLKRLWLKLEDMLGRAIVFFHSGTHTFTGRTGRYLRKVLAFISISIVLFGELACLKWAISNLSHLSLKKGDSFAYLLGNPYTFLFSLCLTLACAVTVLLVRYSVSAKWQAIYSKPQFTEGQLPTPPSLTPNFRILQATDFHITDTDSEPLTEGGGTFSAALLSSIMNAIAQDAHDCDAVLVTGDITDTGSKAAWERFLNSCPDEILSKLILVPGNHDLNLQDHRLARKAEQYDWTARRGRQIRMIAAMAEVMQDRTYVLDRASDRLFTLSRYIERHQNTFNSGAEASCKPGLSVDALWKALFPMVVLAGPERNGKRLGVLVLDSVKPGSLGLTNAIGAVSPEVIDTCSALMNKMADRCDCFVVALHHHVAMPAGGGLRERLQNSGLVLENASLLIDMLAKRGDPTVVFHGHRHKTYTGVATGSDVAIVASPSASIGKGGVAGRGSWRIFNLFCSDNGCWLLNNGESRSLQSRSPDSAPDHDIE
jgi:3',5'-cyclic AMP phosphodiesterase CpdA